MRTYSLFHNSLRALFLKSALALSAVILLAACDIEKGAPNVEQAFPLNVKKTTFSLDLAVPEGGGALVGESRNRLAFFAREFLRRTRSPMTITTAKSDTDAANTAEIVKRELVGAGLRSEAIILKSTEQVSDAKKALVLSFNGYSIKPPECGNWQGHTGLNPSGLPHTNFGCSYQRNLGLMLSDPGDLVQPRIAGAPDATSSDRVIGAHRTGQSTTSAAPSGEKGTISSVAAE